MTTALTTTTPTSMTRATSDQTLIASWLRTKRSAGTQATYGIVIRQFMDWWNWQPLQTLTVDDLSDYKDHLAGSDLSRHTQALRMMAVKSLLSYGHKTGYLPFNAGLAVSAPSAPDDLAERILEEWQVMALLNHASLRPRDRLLLRLLYASGGRVSEIVNLQWRHCQPSGESGQITVTGKGDKTRAIKLSVDTWRALQAARQGAGPSDYVFQSQRRRGQEDRGGRLDRTAVNRIVRKAGRLIGVTNMSPHWLRHAHASHALDKGATLAVVKETLGHGNVSTTSRYLHVRPGESSGLYLGV